jgi:hypothetical protein
LDVIEQMAREAPYYVMRFDKSGEIVEELSRLSTEGRSKGFELAYSP